MRNRTMLGMVEDIRREADGEAGGVNCGAGQLPLRSEVEDRYKWRLEDIYPDEDCWEADAKQVLEDVRKLASLKGRLTASAATLLEGLKLQDQVNERLSRLFVYAKMRRDEDNANPKYQALTDRATSIAVQVDSEKAFVVPEILATPEETLRAYVEQEPGLALYRFYLEQLIRQKPHVLSAEQEQLLAGTGEMASAPSHIFSMFNDADIQFPVIEDESGKPVQLTHGRYMQMLQSRDRRVRREAFEGVLETYRKNRNTLAAIYSASVKKDLFYAQVRRYPGALEAALDEDDVPVAVYDNLIAAVRESLPALHKYLALRKRVLGLDELHMYDLYTPLVPDLDVKIPYDQAVETVKEAIRPLGEEYQRVAAEGLASGWVDVFETRGKTSGAYSWATYGVHPYILLNHQDTLNDMFTLAHELGHAMHYYYSMNAQPFVYANYTIFVAEVASTCNEALLTHHLLETTDDPKMRAYLINHHLETLRGTLFRQTMFAEFEKLVHRHAQEGGALTPEWLCETYYQLVSDYFSAECTVDRPIEMEWARIPHFYSAFYVYKYATGISAATALSQKILREGEPAVEAYLSFLKGGASDYPIPLLRRAGVDMESPEPVRETLRLFTRLVDDLAALLQA
ncbi:oligoendopeptidase F [Alicyclobacillus macrosporangiidus]|uniref:Oligopeptidase F n=1 Tax=Alicyclobacillus macrosporangiidus TaxID=392015 RepID=A0A1I7JS57_9BACL|nr:oligoendopeptidase F [Alicyclobacillus macrosporangiidus]SFU87957.1 oligoendopeptidase F [Alicyclobacillus macrosporangiidus]